MRSPDDIEKIKSRISDPYEVKDLLSSDEVGHLVDLFKNSKNLTVKPSGPVTLNIEYVLEDPVIKIVLEKIKGVLGDFDIASGLFFKATYPHIIHNDDVYELPNTIFKAITLPLELTGNYSSNPKLCFFDQFYFHGPAKFFNGEPGGLKVFNEHVYDYKDVTGITTEPLINNELLTHLKPQWYNGLSLHSALEWKIGSALVFDSTRLHCASDFRSLGITSKLGLSIFTKVKSDQ